ncbi:hypothetical protein EV643_103246 [Kribbella sp. VKM Ac-2527]|uniref:Uncharacterized protein n=1 Tax=Kribbella caucasensis TaxID=2512215 RepID=A0A4R6KJL9_9ACTN|nr:hypothetical protein [Kribbella sp. VKM Ac-2527]TDO51507.1 hypothetical protein EV643_103246 [Kribbella sp. VKM Ac-2527]
MNDTVREMDSRRARWLQYRSGQGLMPGTGDEFARCGLGRLTDGPDLRLLFLPADPEGDVVPLNREVLDWLKQPRESPFGGRYPSWGSSDRATNGAIVLYDQFREDAGWTRYLALHRHGGLEVGIGRAAYEQREIRIFALRPIVGLAWCAAALQAEVADRWGLEGMFEITVALRNTSAATLGDFAEGWKQPGFGLDIVRCLDEHVLIRRELDGMADPESFALDLGDRIEQAFGTLNRRHVARQGEHEGSFDPRFEWF